MKKRILKLIALALVVLTAFSVVGCGGCDWSVFDALFEIQPEVPSGEWNSTDDTTLVTEKRTETDRQSFVPIIDYKPVEFEGAKIVILLPEDNDISREFYMDVPADELDESVCMRNTATEETLNVVIEYERVPIDRGNRENHRAILYDMIAKDFTSELHSYDISVNYAYATVGMAQRGYAANLLDESILPYFEFDLPCWNASFIDITSDSNGERMYYVLGDMQISYYNSAVVTWYNKTLYDNSRDKLDYESLYDMAMEGQWTYEEMYRMVTSMYGEKDGAKPLLINESCADIAKLALPISWGVDFIMKDAAQDHSFNIAGNTKAEDSLSKVRALFDAEGTVYGNEVNFANGEALFFIDQFDANHDRNMVIREMEDKYGLLPLPKYDAASDYETFVGDTYNLISVINYGGGKDIQGGAISAWIELATEESFTSVRGYYFNRVVKPKFFGTDDSQGTVSESIAMFDQIVNNIKFDRASVYSDQLGGMNSLWCDAVDDEDGRTLEEIYEERREQLDEALKSFNGFYE